MPLINDEEAFDFFRLGWRWFGLFGFAAVIWAKGRGWEERRCLWRRWWWRRDPLCRRWQLRRRCVDVWSWRSFAGRWRRRRSLSRLLKTTWASGDDVDEVEVQQEQAKAADVVEDGRQVLDENEVAVDEDGYAERGVGAAISGRTSNDMQKARGWDDSGDDCAGTSPDFYPAAPPDPSLSDKFQPQLDVWNCSSSLMLLHWPNSQMPMPRCIFLTLLCVLTSLDPDFTYLSAMPSEGTAGNVIWTWSTKLVTSAQRAAQLANVSALN